MLPRYGEIVLFVKKGLQKTNKQGNINHNAVNTAL
jgi:hypothetical protein